MQILLILGRMLSDMISYGAQKTRGILLRWIELLACAGVRGAGSLQFLKHWRLGYKLKASWRNRRVVPACLPCHGDNGTRELIQEYNSSSVGSSMLVKAYPLVENTSTFESGCSLCFCSCIVYATTLDSGRRILCIGSRYSVYVPKTILDYCFPL